MLYSNIQHLIIQGNNFNDKDELSLISYIRQCNICVNNETSKFDLYWKAAIRAIYMESAHEVHERIHYDGEYDATNRISHVPFVSTNHLVKFTIHILEKDGLN